MRAGERTTGGSLRFGTGMGAFAALIVAMAITSWTSLARAEEANAGARFTDAIECGEFSVALQIAATATDADQRDHLYSRVALAQSRSGNRLDAITTASEILDDRTRSATLRGMGPAKGAAGGGLVPNFTQLIDLITTTVAPQSWEEAGGAGSISEYRGGVFVDATGELHRILQADTSGTLTGIRLAAATPRETGDARKESRLRKISLTRLEKQVQLRLAAGRAPTKEMALMAGLSKIEYVLVYPETGDVVIAGPAGDWQTDADGRVVSATSGRPIVQLDDLVVLHRYLAKHHGGVFGCSITPTQESLARTKEFIQESSKTPLKAGPEAREAWLKTLQEKLGLQDVTVDGIDPRTRVGNVLVEADYRMKLVGMGLEDGTAKVPSYLSMIKVAPGAQAPPMDVLRWWFTLNYKALQTTDEHDAFAIVGPGVQVLSENELLDAQGKREHTGGSKLLNAQFAHNFTQNFAALAQRYPVYADLQNIFDLALVSALIESEDLPNRVNWRMTCFGDNDWYKPILGPAPAKVETVMNHRVINGKQIIAGVSGGVHVDPWQYVSGKGVEVDKYGKLRAEQKGGAPKDLPRDAWWWD